MNVMLLTEHHLEFLIISLKGDCVGSSESTLVKMPHCWKSHVAAHYYLSLGLSVQLSGSLLLGILRPNFRTRAYICSWMFYDNKIISFKVHYVD